MSLAETIIQEVIQLHDRRTINFCDELAVALEGMVLQRLMSQRRSEYEALEFIMPADFEDRLAVYINKYIHELFIRPKEEQERDT